MRPRCHGPRHLGSWTLACFTAVAVVVAVLHLAAVPHSTIVLASASAVVSGDNCLQKPATRIDCYPPVANFPNATEEACIAQGCCWKALDNNGVPCAFGGLGKPDDAQCKRVSPASRLECRNPRFNPQLNTDKLACHTAGCCYDVDDQLCFQPFFNGYKLLTLDELDDGWRGALVLERFARGPFGNDVPLLQLRVVRETTHRVRVRITDPAFPRFEVPDVIASDDAEPHKRAVRHSDCSYRVHFTRAPFGIAVTYHATGDVLFNSTPPIDSRDDGTAFNGLVFANQFIELSTQLESSSSSNDTDDDNAPVLFGLGERIAPLRLRADDHGDHYPMFARAERTGDAAPHTRDGGDNLAGVHPFWLQVRRSGDAHGVFVLSSNAIDVVTQRRSLTVRTTGGVLDMFVFAGPTPLNVAAQYTDVVGRPAMPPYWALGHHMDAPSTKPITDSVALVAQLRNQGVPLDALWLGTEYMDHARAFTVDETWLSRASVRQLVDDLHFHDQYIVAAQTPAVSTAVQLADDESSRDDDDPLAHADATANATLQRGQALDVFVRGVAGEPVAQKFVGETWAAFVDFFHPNASAFWREQLATLHAERLPFDGLSLELTEPSSTCDVAFAADADACSDAVVAGKSPIAAAVSHHKSVSPDAEDNGITFESAQVRDDNDNDSSGGFVRSSDVAFPFDPYRQPFAPGQNAQHRGGHGNLNARTLPMAASHFATLHYNVHSLYGHAAARTTRNALDHVLQKRSVLLAHATFAGTGQFAGHALASPANSSWTALQLAVAGALQMNLFGVSLTGPTIRCSRVSVELCVRWHQAASLFPLVRTHTLDTVTDVDAYDVDTVNLIRATLLQRYQYLPYVYTQLFAAHTTGSPVLRPLVFEFPRDRLASSVEHQYLVGAALMVSPVVYEGAIAKRVYFPDAVWYDAATGKRLIGAEADRDGDDVNGGGSSADALAARRTIKLLTPLHALQLHVRGGFVVPTQQPATTTRAARRGAFTLLVALDTAHKQPRAAGELFVDDGDALLAVVDKRFTHIAFSAYQNATDRFNFKSVVRVRGYDGPELHAPLHAIKVYGLAQAFHANSSLRATLTVRPADSSSDGDDDRDGATNNVRDVHAEYFANAQMLVLSGLDVAVSQTLHVQVVARPGVPNDMAPSGAKDARASHADASSARSDSGGATQKKPKRKQRYSVLAIVGAVVGALFLLGICVVCVLRCRRTNNGYNPIA